jgi:hypothetical protein
MTLFEYKVHLRNFLKIPENESLMLMCGRKLLSDSMLVQEMYEMSVKCNNEIAYCTIAAFG